MYQILIVCYLMEHVDDEMKKYDCQPTKQKFEKVLEIVSTMHRVLVLILITCYFKEVLLPLH